MVDMRGPNGRGYGDDNYYDESPYVRGAQSRASRGSRAARGQGDANTEAGAYDAPQTGRVYREGRGSAYSSSRASRSAGSANPSAASSGRGGARGVNPVSRSEYHPGLSGYSTYGGAKVGKPGLSRRQLIGVAGGVLGGLALFGIGGVTWWTHRAIGCEVNGYARTVPVGSGADDLISKGYANPVPGNLMSIANAAGEVTMLEKGGGNPYTMTVNGEQVDPATYRVAEGDTIEFQNGTDTTEPVTDQNTESPCGVQFRLADGTLMTPDEAAAGGYYLTPVGCVLQWGKNGVSTVQTGTLSGNVVDLGVTQEAQNLIVGNTHINPEGRLLIALTFDDGPADPYTGQYLDILAQYGAKATFFNLGQNVEAYPELAKRIVDEGHQIASHTYSHQNLPTLSVDDMKAEITKAADAIEKATGVRPTAMRPPYGEFYCKQLLQTLGEIAYSAYWTVDSQDWDVATKMGLEDGAAAIVSYCTANLSGSSHNGAIILMHDGGGDRTRDVVALPGIIEAFQAQGYEFVTLDEMLASDPNVPTWVSSGDASIPADAVIPDLTAYTA